ncbi:MAG TPA: helix-turn-helix domain-containing protein, partial [Rhizomicrobium sp.]
YGRGAMRLAPDAEAMLLTERWVGNVRELSHVIERALLMVDADVIESRHLGLEPKAAVVDAAGPRLEDVEREFIGRMLADCGGNISSTARRLGVSRELLRYRMRKHGLR